MAEILVTVNQAFVLWNDVIAETELVLDAYGSLEKANIYFDNRLRNLPWRKASIDERRAAMIEATDLIDQLHYIGNKHNATQYHQFPRGADTIVPKEVEKACYEIALKLLDGYDPDMEVDTLADVSQGYSTVRNTYDRSFVLEHLRAGIPSAKAWALLKPFLADTRSLRISRVD